VFAAAIELDRLPAVVLAVSVLLAVAAFLAVLTRRLHLPLTLILVLVGFTAGELARSNGVDLPIEGEGFHDVLLFIFLPALVFEAALALPARIFARNLVPILALAVVALVIATVLVGLLVHFGLGVSLTAALVFGALISATDPVAVTATFRELGVPNRLLVLVEGESLLNDGIAIVLFDILLIAALGTAEVSVLEGVGDFAYVFLGGAALGAVLGLGVAEVAARLGRLPSTALTIALAYGSFALGEEIFGFSGVMASVSAALVLSALARTLIPSDEVATWHAVWESTGFVANAILFVLIGVVIDLDILTENLGAIAIAIGAVIVSRPLAIFPLMPLVTRLARIPEVGRQNEMVLVWGGLRGGVALALALAIPDTLPEQEQFIAMTAGVVVATLVVNATTIGPLVKRLGLDQPSSLDRWVAAAARFDGARAARLQLAESQAQTDVERRLAEVETAAGDEIARIGLTKNEVEVGLLKRGLSVERASLQELVDEEVVPQWHARVALNALEDQLDEMTVQRGDAHGLFEPQGLGRLVYAIARRIHLGRVTPEKWMDVAWRDIQARLKATGDAISALEHFSHCPAVPQDVLADVRGEFEKWHERAVGYASQLVRDAPDDLLAAAQRAYATDLAGLYSRRELSHLAELGLVAPMTIKHAREEIEQKLGD
jgi:CPA1 family monovalent cation:H+ antiporter